MIVTGEHAMEERIRTGLVLALREAAASGLSPDEVMALASHELAELFPDLEHPRLDHARPGDERGRADAILAAVSHAALLLLRERAWQTALPELLQCLGEAVQASRTYLVENATRPDGDIVATRLFEWAAPGIPPQLANAALRAVSYREHGLDRWLDTLGADVVLVLEAGEMTDGERALLEPQGVQSLVTVPIFVDGSWWGFMGFDDCVRARVWSGPEVESLRAAAATLCAAIERERSEQAVAEHERKLTAMFETALDAIFITDDEHRYVDVNPAAAELLGVAREELIGRRVEEFLPPDSRPRFEAEWTHFTSQQVVREEWESLRADGEVRQVEASARPNFVPGLHIAFLRDVTDRKRLEAELLRAQKLESIGRLAGGIAHDFNNLLTAIGGYTELLLEHAAGDPTYTPDLEEIRDATARAVELTRQLLAFGRRQLLRPVPVDLNDVVRGVSALLRRLVGERSELELDLATGLGSVSADPTRLEQALVNLVVNARAAMPEGGRVTVSTRRVERDGAAFVALAVADTGTGMDEATRLRIFDPFFTTRRDGIGLGLASVHGIVQQSGGDIEVQAAPGEGATFTILLPTVSEPPAAPAEPAAAPANAERTILLVEDQEVVRALTRRMLERDGYRVLEAAQGTEAIELAERHEGTIDLLLTDVVMPGLRGPEVAALVRERRPEIAIIYMSGYADDVLTDVTTLTEGGFVEKPYSAEILSAKVRAALERA
jgi:PAS domain S-box-containing protein